MALKIDANSAQASVTRYFYIRKCLTSYSKVKRPYFSYFLSLISLYEYGTNIFIKL